MQDFTEELLDRTCVRGFTKTFRGKAVRPRSLARFKKSLFGYMVKTRKEGCNVQSKSLPTYLELKMAQEKLSDTQAALARQFQVHPKTVAGTLCRVADFAVEAQFRLLKALTSWLQESAPRLRFAAASLMYDEASQRLAVPMAPGANAILLVPGTLTADTVAVHEGGVGAAGDAGVAPRLAALRRRRQTHRVVTVEIFASRCFFQWWQGEGAAPRALEIILPPFGVASSAARSLWAVIRQHPLMQPVLEFKKALLDAAAENGGVGVDLEQTDNASGNDLFFAATTMVDNPDWAKDRQICLNHQSHHCLLTVVKDVFGTQLVGTLYTLTSFLRMGTYLLRCVLALKHFLAPAAGHFVVSESRIPESDQEFSRALKSYIMDNYSGQQGSRKVRRPRARVARSMEWGIRVWSATTPLQGAVMLSERS